MRTKILILSLIAITLISCRQKENLSNQMLGNWQTTFIRIAMPTQNGSEKFEIYEDDFSTKESIIAQSIYKSDSTFLSWYLSPNGEKINETEGNWFVQNDSLFVRYSYGGRVVESVYAITMKENSFIGNSIYDWDNDGEHDDTLQMKAKRIEL